MRALEVRLNGKKLCVAGIGNDGVVSANVNCVPRAGKDEMFLDTGGLDASAEEHLRWHECKLKAGDTVQMTIVEVPKADKPKTRKRIKVSSAEQLRLQKQYVRDLAKKLGWKIQTRPAK